MAADVPYSDNIDDVTTHEDSYRAFVELVYVAALHIANFLLALAIGAVEGHWEIALFIMAVATALSVYSLMRRAKAPLAGLTVLSLLALGAAAA